MFFFRMVKWVYISPIFVSLRYILRIIFPTEPWSWEKGFCGELRAGVLAPRQCRYWKCQSFWVLECEATRTFSTRALERQRFQEGKRHVSSLGNGVEKVEMQELMPFLMHLHHSLGFDKYRMSNLLTWDLNVSTVNQIMLVTGDLQKKFAMEHREIIRSFLENNLL